MLGVNVILNSFPCVCGFLELVSKPWGRDNRSTKTRRIPCVLQYRKSELPPVLGFNIFVVKICVCKHSMIVVSVK